MKYLKFNNKSSEDFKLGIVKVRLGTPKPNLITEKVPHCNGTFDFSTIATGGLKTYSDRIISVDFNYVSDGQEDLYNKFSEITSWLLAAPKGILTFNYIGGNYTGQCTQISNLNSFVNYGSFTAQFTCNPFLDCGAASAYIWDTFSFITGIASINIYKVNTGETIEIQNEGVGVNPTINTDVAISISINKKIYNLNIGDNKIFGLNLVNGENKIKIIKAENASICFNYRKEMI